MGFSPLADMSRRIPHGNRQSTRKSKITGFTIHHNAGVNSYGEATNPNREVSAQYWITNEGAILPQIDETMRAWTTGSSVYPAGAASDHRNITVEVSNSPEGVRTKTWAISSAAERALEKLIGDVFRRHALGPVRRGLTVGVGVHRDYVKSTACPGGYIMNKLPVIIVNAEKYRLSGGAPTAPTPKPTPPATGVSAPPFPKGLAPNKSVPSAKTLQTQLKRAGFLARSVTLSNNYGPKTQDAVAKFHYKHTQFRSAGKARDIAIGPKGWAYLFTKY